MKTLDYMRGWNDAISKMQEDLDGLPAIWKESMWHRLHHLRSLAGPISRPPTQGASSLPPSRADLGGDRVSKLVGRWRNLAELNNTKGEHGSLVAEAQMKCADQLETAVAEGRQSASLGERERLSPEMILKADRETGSTHMTDQQKWGELMAGKLNAALAGNDTPQYCHAGSDGECNWKDCPQEANNRANYQTFCPLATSRDTEGDQ